MKEALTFIAAIVLMLFIVAVCMSLPALLVMLAFNWIAPQFGVAVHLGFFQVWVGLWALGVVGRIIFGSATAGRK